MRDFDPAMSRRPVHCGMVTELRTALGDSRRIGTAPPVTACPLRLHRPLALRSLCDGHHKKALSIAELRKKNRAFLTAPALAGISSDPMQSQEATDNCRRRPIGLCADAQIRDDGPNMETYHEGTYRSSRVGHADCSPDIRSPG